jgi:serine/threonine protein kinase
MTTSARPSTLPAFGLRLPERYRVRRHIATGGMASVWCADDRILSRQVAIKILADRFAHDEVAVRRFQREARAAARVSAHPHVVTIYDVGDVESDGDLRAPRAFIVMEFLAGGTVADALRCKAVGREDAIRWLREAASALDHAHERGIVHRDIKPANFLLDTGRGLHVADFGIAHLQSEDTITSTGQLFGTAAYLAPEQALGEEATGASDRYALAVAGFELLTGGRPFTATHFAAQARQHIEDEPPRASQREPSISPAADEVLRRGMAKKPADRYATAAAFVDALETALDAPAPGATAATRALAPAAITLSTSRSPRSSAATRPPTTGRHRPLAPPRDRPRGRALALAALAVVALGVIALLTQLSGGTAKHAAARHRTTVASRHARAAKSATVKPKPATSGSSSSSSSTTAASSTSSAPTTAAGLQALGHQEMLDGNYPAAIANLRQAMASAPTGSLTYAYAMYDLANSLLLSGNPQAALPVAEQRLKIPNQTPVVQALVDRIKAALGQGPAGPGPKPNDGGAGIPPGHQPGHGHGNGH